MSRPPGLRRLLATALAGLVVLTAAGAPATAAPALVVPAVAAPALVGPAAPAPAASGGVLYVSGLRAEYHQSWDPRGGRLHLEMTVRNATAQVLDASVSYGARTLVGVDLGAGDNISVRGLAPGEVRTIETDVDGIGQWGLLEAHMTVSPPADVLGVQVTPLDRARWVFVPPWYAIGLLVLVVGAVVLLRRYPVRRRPRARRRARKPAVVQ
jgi:hypothetical protein